MFYRSSGDWINLHKKNETAGAELKTSMVILPKTLFWNEKKNKKRIKDNWKLKVSLKGYVVRSTCSIN